MDMNLVVNCRMSHADRAFMSLWLLQVLTTPLIHRDHPDSPLPKAYNTSSYSERVEAVAQKELGSSGLHTLSSIDEL
jgi:hypothetical protein